MSKAAVSAVPLPVDESNIGRIVNRLAFPIIVENLLQTLLGLVDLALVGRLGAAAVAGVGTGTQIVWLYISALGAVSVGTTVLVARFTGAGEPGQANRAVKQSILIGLAISVVLMLVGHFFSEEIVRAMGAEEDVVQLGGQYLRITSDLSVFLVLSFIGGAALRGAGDSKTPMIATGVANAINVVLAYGLIFGELGLPRLEVAGAAYATAAARAISTGILLFVLFRGQVKVSLRGRGGWRPDVDLMRRMLRVGIPSMIEQVTFSAGMLVYSIIVLGLGTTVFATMRIAFMLLGISFLPGFGYAMAATTLTGQSLGARRPDLAERSTRYAMSAAFVWMTTMGAVFFLFGDHLMRLFTDDPEIVALGFAALKVIAFSQPLQAPAQVLAGGLRGAGDTRYPMMLTSLSMWLVRVPVGWLFAIPLGFGLPGVFVSAVLDGAIRAGGAWLRYRKGHWRNITV